MGQASLAKRNPDPLSLSPYRFLLRDEERTSNSPLSGDVAALNRRLMPAISSGCRGARSAAGAGARKVEMVRVFPRGAKKAQPLVCIA